LPSGFPAITSLKPPQKLQQLGKVDRNSPRLVTGEQTGRRALECLFYWLRRECLAEHADGYHDGKGHSQRDNREMNKAEAKGEADEHAGH
jgi:hypothetical protein